MIVQDKKIRVEWEDSTRIVILQVSRGDTNFGGTYYSCFNWLIFLITAYW